MLKPIPVKILTHSISVAKTTGVDKWQKPIIETVEQERVCVQSSNDTVIDKDDTKKTLNSILFVDANFSYPYIDYQAIKDESERNGKPLVIIYNDRRYIVVKVETLIDDEGNIHHWEVALV